MPHPEPCKSYGSRQTIPAPEILAPTFTFEIDSDLLRAMDEVEAGQVTGAYFCFFLSYAGR